MAVGNMNLGRSLRRNVPEIAGGSVGVGAPVLLRETLDVRNGMEFSLIGASGTLAARLTRPSVAYGLGAGALTGLLWAMDMDFGMNALSDFYLTHTLTSIPAGAVSAAMPRTATTTTAGAQARSASARSRSTQTARTRQTAMANGGRGAGGGGLSGLGELSQVG